MTKTIAICGFGPGISNAVAEKFAAEGFSVALAARNVERLNAGVKALEAKGAKAAAFPTDLADPKAAAALAAQVTAKLGSLDVIHWNAYSGTAGDLLNAEPADVRSSFDIAVTSPLALLRAALPALRKGAEPAVLFTNGGLGFTDPKVDAMGVEWNAMGLSVANAAKHKLVGLLAVKLKADKIYVGEIMVNGMVKGTAFDAGNATIDPKTVAGKFWSMYRERSELSALIA